MSDQMFVYTVAGMSCEHCKVAVSGEVAKVPGVELVDIDLATKRVVVRGVDLDDETVRAAIDEAGYGAVPVA